MTTQSQNKKTVRHFQCRDYLWEIFEQMSAELECSTDYLINEAMRQYARSRNYGTNRSLSDSAAAITASRLTTPVPEVHAASVTPLGVPIPSLRSAVEERRSVPSNPTSLSSPTSPSTAEIRKEQRAQRAVTAPRPPSLAQMKAPSSMPPPPPRRPSSSGGNLVTTPVPPPLPSGSPGVGGRTQRVPLFAIFGGQKIPINKDEYVIGRSAKAADLPIKDGNISRRHAAIVFQGGAFYIKDLGSTNGVEFDGRQIDSKRIEEGDVFRLCDYEIQFTYR